MYIKRTRKWRSSREITYLSLAHGIREERPEGKRQTRPLILMSLGPKDEVDPVYLKDVVSSALATFDRRVAEGTGAVEAAQDVARSFEPHLSQVRVLANRKPGTRFLPTPHLGGPGHQRGARPCYHRSLGRIRAHVMLTILAANCVRTLELKTGENIVDRPNRYGRIIASQVTEYGRKVWKSSDLSAEDLAALRNTGAGDVPASWHHWRELTSTAGGESARAFQADSQRLTIKTAPKEICIALGGRRVP